MSFRVRSLMVLVAVSAMALLVIKSMWLSATPRFRTIAVINRQPDGSIGIVEMTSIHLDAPASDFHGMPDGETRYREKIADLEARKAEYKVTSPRGFHPNGEPIY